MGRSILYLDSVTVSFDGFKAIDDLSIFVDPGELRFLIGPNGAGKTTLLDVVCGKVKPTTGSAFFREVTDIVRLHEHEIAQLGIGRKFQTPSVFTSLTVYENLELSLHQKKGVFAALLKKKDPAHDEKILSILKKIGLASKVGFKAGSLSHGEKQWLEIGMLLAQEPAVLLLDEPVAGMSKEETEKTGVLLQEIVKERTVVVVEHDMDFVRKFASMVTVMHEGKILCEGSMDKVQNDPRVIEVYLGRG